MSLHFSTNHASCNRRAELDYSEYKVRVRRATVWHQVSGDITDVNFRYLMPGDFAFNMKLGWGGVQGQVEGSG